ncbi:MAG: 4-hydroxy-tetrahydrodipicolinate reductase [Verrucomicrobiota bacterium]|jgi:4-hydroxy-tetrahydrodipicolinate reductase
MKKVVRAALIGAAGRMGQAIAAAADAESVRIVSKIDQGDEIRFADAEIIVDFSEPGGTSALCDAAMKAKLPLVIGTTGHSAVQRNKIDATAKKLPIVLAANFSVGVNALFWLTEQAARILGQSFDLEIIEMHHRSKKDAPSGTAKTLADILQRTRHTSRLRHGREGIVGERDPSEIGIHAVRGGDIVGEHTILFAGDGERLELTHRAASRETFARGALRAAHWIIGREPGLYNMRDVLELT